MQHAMGRPAGIIVIACLVALSGLLSLWDAFSWGMATQWNGLMAAFAVLVGVLLLYRAYTLWGLRHLAWLYTIIIVAIRGAHSLIELLTAQSTTIRWLMLILAAIAIVYLLRPAVRRYFNSD